uniref:RNA binding protein n=1 Tax=Colletotrichum fructicola (strain Nara gc5) TaxID=1213859 RepID=L2G2K6_COLFN
MGHGGGRMGGSGVVPFRAGDWKCGNEVCGYHNFAKNVCCLRCGASRAGAAVVADSGGYPSPMDPPSNYSMSQGSMSGTPGPGPRAAEADFQSASNGPASAGPSNNFYSQNENDPFAFLSSGIGGLSVSGGDSRQNGGAAPPSKSPA